MLSFVQTFIRRNIGRAEEPIYNWMELKTNSSNPSIMDEDHGLINLINKLQSFKATTGCDININLPEIVVVGAQSSGKSSVLDGLIGFSILPRGAGTVTKCPIIVQLITTTNPAQAGVEVEGSSAGKIADYDVARKLIKDRMEENQGNITDVPIIVRIFSPDVITLTVVDLPGIKRISSSDENNDVAELIFSVCRKRISNENAIILAVSPANYEICNSDGILLAREADEHGLRTIGVLTKLDLMDEGTDARDLLMGTSKHVTVKLGMIGIVNRSQKDIDNNMGIARQLRNERKFLREVYPDLAQSNGVPYLRNRLHGLLVDHILKCLPEVQNKLETILSECEQRLESIPDVGTPKDKYSYTNRVITRLENDMKTEIEGSTRNPEYSYVYGGIRIKDVFEETFAQEMEAAGKLSNSKITDKMILTAFRNSGAYDSVFVYPEAVFRKLAQNQVEHILSPALQCADDVYREIMSISIRLFKKKENCLKYFPELKKTLNSVVHEMLDKKLDEVKKQIKDYIRVQSGNIFSLDLNFLKCIEELRRKLEAKLHESDNDELEKQQSHDQYLQQSICGLPNVPLAANRPNKMSFAGHTRKQKRGSNDQLWAKLQDPEVVRLIKEMVNVYFNHAKSQIQDYVPKLISDRLITQFSSDGSLGEQLRLSVLDCYEQLVNLPNDMKERRERDVILRKHLKDALCEIRDLISSRKYSDEMDEHFYKKLACTNGGNNEREEPDFD